MLKIDWQHLSERDKWALLIGGTSVGLYLFFALIINPLNAAVSERQQALEDKTSLVSWMEKAYLDVKAIPQKKEINTAKLSTLMTQALKAPPFTKYPFKIQQTQSDKMIVSFEKVPFSPLMQWLESLSQTTRLRINTIDAKRTPTPGIATVTMELQTTTSSN